MKLIFTDRSRKQLDIIYRFYEQKSVRTAANIYNKILDEIEILKNFPQLAPLEPLLSEEVDTYRSLVVRKLFKVVYCVRNDTIYISAIWDCRQSPEKLKREFKA